MPRAQIVTFLQDLDGMLLPGNPFFTPPAPEPPRARGRRGGGARENGEALAFVRFGSPPTNNHAGRRARSVPCDRS